MRLELIALYVGPDQVMPVMSILATIVGFLLVFWNKVLSLLRKVFRRSSGSNAPAGPTTPTTQNDPPQQT